MGGRLSALGAANGCFRDAAFSPLTPYRESGLKVASRHFGFGSIGSIERLRLFRFGP